jgi:hypothetical protein
MSDTVSASSLKNLEVRLTMSIDAAMQAEADLNILRSKAGMEPAEKRFFLAAEARIAVREAVAEAKAGTKPEPKPYSWRNPPAAAAPPVITAHFDPTTCLRAVRAALRDRRLTASDWPIVVMLLAKLGTRDAAEPTSEQAEFISDYCNHWASTMRKAVGPAARDRILARHAAWLAKTQDDDWDKDHEVEVDEDGNPVEDETEPDAPDDQDEGDPPPVTPERKPSKSEAVVTATPEMILRSAAIARGTITPLPTDPLAREIIRAGQRRRSEKEDPPL